VTGATETAMRVDLDGIDRIVPFEVPLRLRFRGVEVRHGLLLHGEAGWAEWSPFDEYADDVAARWLAAALAAARSGPPAPLREQVPVNVTVPATDPDRAYALVATSGCRTAKVKVAEPGQRLDDDVARVAAVRAALGSTGRIRLDANGAWDVPEALAALEVLVEAADGLEYVEQPCMTLPELAEVRRRSGVRVAADEAIRRDGAGVEELRDAVDVAVVKVQPSGGTAEVLELARALDLPVVVSSALETSVGLAAGVHLAAALPERGAPTDRADAGPPACGLATGLLLAADVVDAPLVPHDGSIGVGQARAATVALAGVVPAPSAALSERMLVRLASCAELLGAAAGGRG